MGRAVLQSARPVAHWNYASKDKSGGEGESKYCDDVDSVQVIDSARPWRSGRNSNLWHVWYRCYRPLRTRLLQRDSPGKDVGRHITTWYPGSNAQSNGGGVQKILEHSGLELLQFSCRVALPHRGKPIPIIAGSRYEWSNAMIVGFQIVADLAIKIFAKNRSPKLRECAI